MAEVTNTPEVAVSSPPVAAIPEQVKEFIRTFYKNYLENNVSSLHYCYEHTFNKLTDKYYSNSAWPDPFTQVAPLVDNDQVFLVLYSEVYYRHIYAKLDPTLEQRTNSYNNYCNLFNLILNHEGGPVTFELPDKWLWDIIDEFIYQFNQFSIYRSKLIIKSSSNDEDSLELNFLQQHVEIWSSYSVLNALYSLIGRSKIYEQLNAQKNNLSFNKINEIAGVYGSLPLYRNLGYFSIIGLLRIHTLLGDFTLALKTMEDIQLSKKSFITEVPGAHFTTYYYAGFCYLMIHRYSDAIKTFSHILLYISRTRNISKSGQYDAITKKSDQMYALLTILIGLCPTRIDDILQNNLKEKYSDELAKVVKGGENSLKTIETLFGYGSPRFISISLPNFDYPELNIDAMHFHLTIFMSTVKNTVFNNILKTYLNLYSSMELEKLLKFLESDEDVKIKDLDELKEILLAFKLTNTQIKWVEGSKSSETIVDDTEDVTISASSSSTINSNNNNNNTNTSGGLLNGASSNVYDFDITLNGNLIQIIEVKIARKFSDWFIRSTNMNFAIQDSIRNERIGDSYKKDQKRGKKTNKR